MEKYFLIHERLLVKGEFNSKDSSLASQAYKYENTTWTKMDVNQINDRLMGYDPTEDDFYKMGNSEIMAEIREITDEEAKQIINRRIES